MLSRVFRKFCGVKFWIQKPGDQVFYWEIEGDCVRLCEIVWGPLCQYSPVTYRDVLTVTQPSVVVRTHISGHTRSWCILYIIIYSIYRYVSYYIVYHYIFCTVFYLAARMKKKNWRELNLTNRFGEGSYSEAFFVRVGIFPFLVPSK